MMIINTASVTLFPSNNPATSNLNRDTSPKSLNLFARFKSKDDNFVTPNGIPAFFSPMIVIKSPIPGA